MTRDKLVQYCDLQNEINKLEKRIDRLEKQSEMISDVVQNGHKRHVIIYGHDYKRVYKLDMLKITLQKRYDMALNLQTEIEEYINTIPKSDIRQIFEHRYIDNMNWFQIQIEMGYRHEDTARKKHDKFLEESL